MNAKRVLLINDICCFGKASITVSLPLLSAMGIECVLLPTAVLSTHTGGLGKPVITDMSESMLQTAEHFQQLNLSFDAIYVSYLANEEQVELVKTILSMRKGENTIVFYDPAMADEGKLYSGFDISFVKKVKELCKAADVIFANQTEAQYLSGNRENVIEKLREEGIYADIVLKGERKEYGKIRNIYACEDGRIFDEHTYLEGHFHGTGDVFASVLIGCLLTGVNKENALKKAGEVTYRCVKKSIEEGIDERYGLPIEDMIKEGL